MERCLNAVQKALRALSPSQSAPCVVTQRVWSAHQMHRLVRHHLFRLLRNSLLHKITPAATMRAAPFVPPMRSCAEFASGRSMIHCLSAARPMKNATSLWRSVRIAVILPCSNVHRWHPFAAVTQISRLLRHALRIDPLVNVVTWQAVFVHLKLLFAVCASPHATIRCLNAVHPFRQS